MLATMFRKPQHKLGVCADCGQPPKTSYSASTRSSAGEYVCTPCMMWRKTAEHFRVGFWGALFHRRTRPQH